MIYWSPDPVSGFSYNYDQSTTRGFSLTHLSGPGCGVFGDVPIFPMLGLPTLPPPVHGSGYSASYRHQDETAEPGYYAVKFSSGIQVRLAAAVHAGIAEFAYPAGGDAHTLLIDLSRNLSRVDDTQIQIEGNRITGSVAGGGFCHLDNRYRVYFAIETEQTPTQAGSFDELRVRDGQRSAAGPRSGGYIGFASSTRTVRLKAGLSFVSIANASENLAREIPGWDLEQLRRQARADWNRALGHIVVSGGDAAHRTVFYTALYHSLLHPTVFSDLNGQYLGFDGVVHQAGAHRQYANFSGWDIYRSQVQLIAMLMPDVASDLAQSLVNDAEQGGGLPIWPVANDESSCMVGDPAAPILSSIYAFGARNFDAHKALALMIRGADDPSAHSRLYLERPGLGDFLARGYIPVSEQNPNPASVTLEDESADFTVARLASAFGDKSTAERLLWRSDQWRKLFDPATGYIRARNDKGEFLPNFKPEMTDGYVEGNAAQYTWMVPFNLGGLIKAIGGPEAARKRLDDYFSQNASWYGGPYFFIANEPSFGNPWIYNWTGHPWRTQEVVRKTLDDLFTATPEGLPGNDDLGATSSWVIFASLGLFPEIPGVGGLTVSTPQFPLAEIKLGDHTLRIVSEGAPQKRYVESVAVDGARVRNWWIGWDELSHAKEVKMTLSPTPKLEPGQQPPSFAPPAQLGPQ
jgi:predicted alpha-1,2-mannosidase